MISFCLLCTRLFSYHQMNYTISIWRYEPLSSFTKENALFTKSRMDDRFTCEFFSIFVQDGVTLLP